MPELNFAFYVEGIGLVNYNFIEYLNNNYLYSLVDCWNHWSRRKYFGNFFFLQESEYEPQTIIR